MRFKNEKSDLKLYAVTGTQTVLLSFDIDKKKLDNKKFIGFSVQRKDKQGRITYHNGTKRFPSLVDNPDKKISSISYVQSFYWQDYTVDPGQTYSYTIKPMFGAPESPASHYESTLEVTTEKLNDGKHSVFFNYGVTGSQGTSVRNLSLNNFADDCK
jgi:hypothetical protein